ncbi:twin-arginine translocation pathway signal [Mycolicibacterium moriokaense]|nr:twin-arginine translocation pathway signal [Mycolicibacterium moriokaense]
MTEDKQSEATAAETEAVEADESAKPNKPGVARRTLAGLRRFWVAVVLALALVAALVLASWMYFFVYQPDRQTDNAAAKSAIQAASDGTVAILTYSPESLDKDFATAKSKLTGDFLSYYTQFTEQIVAPAAKQKSVKTKASVVRAAVSELHPDNAVVLVFINQTTQSADRTDASFINSAVRVTLKKIDGAWLISSFDPV